MAGSSSAFEDEDSGRMITDINVTPLVDVTLVLLIIFMVTTSYIVSPSIKVDLPKAASGTEQEKSALAVSIDKAGNLFLNGERTDEAGLTKFIAAELPKNRDLQAIIAADKIVSHGQVVRVIDLVKRAGILRFAINVEAPGSLPAAP